jgi:tripeptide aminopeptidase
MLELVRELVESGQPHAGVELVLTPCEEVGLLGAKAFDTSKLKARFGYCYDHANDIGKIVAEAPTQMSLRATIVGKASHSGIAPEEGRNAIAAMATALGRMKLGRIDDRTTANVGIIEGGSAVNIIPDRCSIRGEARSLDHDRAAIVAQEMVDALASAAAEHGCELELTLDEEYRAYSFSASSPPVKLISQALSDAGYTPQLVPCGGGSDANVFNANGMPCVNVCNAMREIHTSDEHIFVEDLEAMLRVSRALVSAAVR